MVAFGAMARENLRVVDEDESPGDSQNTLTVEELAAASGMTVRNIRAHQARGLLHPPEVRQRVGYYGPSHVSRLELITQLQADGFNLKGIERLLEGASGATSDSISNFRRAIQEPFESERPQILTLGELRERFGENATPSLLARAMKLELISPVGPNSFEVASPRLLEIAEEVLRRGVPVAAMFEVVQVIQRSSGYVAEAFAKMFVESIWKPFEEEGRPEEQWDEVVESIQGMRPVASEAMLAVFQMTMTKTVEQEFSRELSRMSGKEPKRRKRR